MKRILGAASSSGIFEVMDDVINQIIHFGEAIFHSLDGWRISPFLLELGKLVAILASVFVAYLRFRQLRSGVGPLLAQDITSWDISSKFPITPVRELEKFAAFPYIPSSLNERIAGEGGMYTATNIRLWNAGGRPLMGPLTDPRVRVMLSLPLDSSLNYSFTAMLSNDQQISMGLGRSAFDSGGGYRHIPVRFDVLRPGKGILIGVRHNFPHADDFKIKCFLLDCPDPIVGVYHVFRGNVASWVNRFNFIGAFVFSILSYILFLNEFFVMGLFSISVAFLNIVSILLWKSGHHSPTDLVWDGQGVKLHRF